MRRIAAWSILVAVFLLAGEGLNLFRLYIVRWIAFGRWQDALMTLVGLGIAGIATAFLGGFVYYRDKKRGKLKREGWRGRPVKPKRAERTAE
ncbi:MAG: DUF2627 domain-containing protein [Alicyclobacillus sp.]|nr:DUF2627 domain-containing protein [Alicyclobacillus sp.]